MEESNRDRVDGSCSKPGFVNLAVAAGNIPLSDQCRLRLQQRAKQMPNMVLYFFTLLASRIKSSSYWIFAYFPAPDPLMMQSRGSDFPPGFYS